MNHRPGNDRTNKADSQSHTTSQPSDGEERKQFTVQKRKRKLFDVSELSEKVSRERDSVPDGKHRQSARRLEVTQTVLSASRGQSSSGISRQQSSGQREARDTSQQEAGGEVQTDDRRPRGRSSSLVVTKKVRVSSLQETGAGLSSKEQPGSSNSQADSRSDSIRDSSRNSRQGVGMSTDQDPEKRQEYQPSRGSARTRTRTAGEEAGASRNTNATCDSASERKTHRSNITTSRRRNDDKSNSSGRQSMVESHPLDAVNGQRRNRSGAPYRMVDDKKAAQSPIDATTKMKSDVSPDAPDPPLESTKIRRLRRPPPLSKILAPTEDTAQATTSQTPASAQPANRFQKSPAAGTPKASGSSGKTGTRSPAETQRSNGDILDAIQDDAYDPFEDELYPASDGDMASPVSSPTREKSTSKVYASEDEDGGSLNSPADASNKDASDYSDSSEDSDGRAALDREREYSEVEENGKNSTRGGEKLSSRQKRTTRRRTYRREVWLDSGRERLVDEWEEMVPLSDDEMEVVSDWDR